MSKKQFSLDLWLKDKSQKVVTRCGYPVRIIAWDVDSNQPIVAALRFKDSFHEVIRVFTTDGQYSTDADDESALDLFIETDDPEVSEDEKVRKRLIVLAKGSLAHTDEEINEMLAWLEKQGEKPCSDCIPDEECAGCEYHKPDEPFNYENANIQQKDFASLGLTEHEKEVLRLMTDTPLSRIDIKDLKEESAVLLGYAFKEFQETFGEVNRMSGYEEGKADALKELPKWEKIAGSISDVIPLTNEGFLYWKNWRIKVADVWDKLEKEE